MSERKEQRKDARVRLCCRSAALGALKDSAESVGNIFYGCGLTEIFKGYILYSSMWSNTTSVRRTQTTVSMSFTNDSTA